MSAVDVGICHDDDFVVAGLFNIKVLADPCAKGSDHRFQRIRCQDTVKTGFLNVQDLTTQGKNRLNSGVAARFGRAARGIPFHDKYLRHGRVFFTAVCQLTRQGRGIPGAFTSGELTCFFGCLARSGSAQCFFDNGFSNGWVFF